MKITKADLVKNIYEKKDFERQTVQEIVDAFIIELKDQLAGGATIELRGLGTFDKKLRKGRPDAKNPKTGEHCGSVPHYVSCFRAGQELKNALLALKVENLEK